MTRARFGAPPSGVMTMILAGRETGARATFPKPNGSLGVRAAASARRAWAHIRLGVPGKKPATKLASRPPRSKLASAFSTRAASRPLGVPAACLRQEGLALIALFVDRGRARLLHWSNPPCERPALEQAAREDARVDRRLAGEAEGGRPKRDAKVGRVSYQLPPVRTAVASLSPNSSSSSALMSLTAR
jgi:hypothetical protein